MAMFGADVDELNTLANQMELASSALSSSRARIGSQVSNSAWVGPVADRFRLEWASTNSRRIAAAIDLLSSAATVLHQNAQDQSRASAADYSAGPGLTSFGDPGIDPVKRFGDLLGILGNGDEAIGDINLLSHLNFLDKGPFASWDKYLGPIGSLFAAGSVAADIHARDAIGTILDGTSGIAGTASWVAPLVGVGGTAALGLSVVGAGIGVGVAFVNATLPYSTSSQDDMFRYVLHEQFGANANVDPEHLTSEQAQFMSHRYDGPFGVAQMISDKMNQTGEPIQHASAVTTRWVADTAAPAVEHAVARTATEVEHAATDVEHSVAQLGDFVSSFVKGIKL